MDGNYQDPGTTRHSGGAVRNDQEIRMVMVGKTGIGKSTTGNTILGRRCFESKFSAKSLTADCAKGRATVNGRKVVVIDTPGLFDTRFGHEKTSEDICQCISYAAPGPHIFLVVVRLGRFTEEEKETVQRIQEMFGQAADQYSMVLFTGGDLLEDTAIEDFIAGSSELQELVARCNGQYHVFNNKLSDRSQVSELLQKIQNIVRKNGGSHYTNDMFQEAERVIEEKKQLILKEKEEKIREEREAMERELQEKYDKEMKRIQEHMEDEREREKREREEERKREKQEMDEERTKERNEREADRKRDKEEKDSDMNKMMQDLKERHDRELQEGRRDLENRFSREARDEAEGFNPLYPLIQAGQLFLNGLKEVGKVMKNCCVS